VTDPASEPAIELPPEPTDAERVDAAAEAALDRHAERGGALAADCDWAAEQVGFEANRYARQDILDRARAQHPDDDGGGGA
jgi:hypothetical protein